MEWTGVGVSALQVPKFTFFSFSSPSYFFLFFFVPSFPVTWRHRSRPRRRMPGFAILVRPSVRNKGVDKCDSLIRRLLCLSFPEDNLVTAVCFGGERVGGGGGRWEGRERERELWSDAKLKFQPAFIRDSTRDSGSPCIIITPNCFTSLDIALILSFVLLYM